MFSVKCLLSPRTLRVTALACKLGQCVSLCRLVHGALGVVFLSAGHEETALVRARLESVAFYTVTTALTSLVCLQLLNITDQV